MKIKKGIKENIYYRNGILFDNQNEDLKSLIKDIQEIFNQIKEQELFIALIQNILNNNESYLSNETTISFEEREVIEEEGTSMYPFIILFDEYSNKIIAEGRAYDEEEPIPSENDIKIFMLLNNKINSLIELIYDLKIKDIYFYRDILKFK